MNKIAVVDFSWCLYRFKNSLKELSCEKDGQTIPTGHIYGTIKFVKELSDRYDRVILCRDSHNCFRKQISSSYKSNRHKVTGDWFFDYDVHKDSDNIVKMLSRLPNVFVAEKEGFEADDIIAYFIKKSRNWDFYFRDTDILQTRGEYQLMVTFSQPLLVGNAINRNEAVKTKCGVSKDFLPMIWKVVKGDSGDCIPIGLKRFPSKDLTEICSTVESDNLSFEEIINLLLKHEYKGIWKERIQVLKDKNSETYKKLEMNYNLVKPAIPEEVSLKRFEFDKSLFSVYNINQEKLLLS